jgi:CDP-glycerol glycerophosphotransferase (TagB/SpsB family)
MKINKRDPSHWLLLLRQGIYTLIAILARHVSPRPAKPVVIMYGHQLSGNLKALYHEWQERYREKFDCYFLSLDPLYSQQLREQGVCVLQCGRLRDMLLVGRCNAMITDHGLHAMRPFIAMTNIIFIDVWHGIPFKGFIPDDFRVQHRYDEVWVSSPLLKEVYQNKFGFKPEIVHNLGYARADKLFARLPPDPAFRQQASIPPGDTVVLYAPTWQQDDKGRELFPFGESQDTFIQRLSEVCRDNAATLVIRSHLNASIRSNAFDNVRYCSMKEYPDSESLLQHTDILICDWSSIAFDYLALDRPTIFLDVEPPFRNSFSLGSEYRFGCIVTSMAALVTSLANILENPETYFLAHKAAHGAITYEVYGENTDGKAAARQLDRLVTVVART